MDFIYFLAFWGVLGVIVGILALIQSNKLNHSETESVG